MAQQVPRVAGPLNVAGSARGDHQGFICRTSGAEIKRVFARWQTLCASQAPTFSPRSTPSSQSLVDVLDCLERTEVLWKAVVGGMDKGTHTNMERQLAGLGKDLDMQVLKLEEQLQQARWAQARSRAEIARQLVHGRRAAAAAAMAVAEAAASRSADSDLRSAAIDITQLADIGQLDPSPSSRAFMESAYRQAEQEFKTQLDKHANAFREEKQRLQQRLEKLSDDTSNNTKKHEDLVARLKEKLLKKTGRSALPTPTSAMGAGKIGEAKKLPPIRDGGTPSPRAGGRGSPSSRAGGRGSPASRGGGSTSSTREISADDASSKNMAKRWGIHFVEQLGVNSYPTKPAKWHGCMEDLRRNVTPRHARSREEAMQQSLEMTNTADLVERIGSILELPRVLPAFNVQSSMDSFWMTEESSMELRSTELL